MSASISKIAGLPGRVARRSWNRLALLAAACGTLMSRTKIRRWESVAAAGPPPWDERNKILAQFIPSGASVLDLGAGAQTLRTHIGPSCRYQPCDVVRNPGVLFCDFNAGIYPPVRERFDYVICSGVMEYVWDPRGFISRISGLGRNVLLSYNCLAEDESKLQRLAKNWVNHLSVAELEAIFGDLGLRFAVLHTRQPNEVIYHIEPEVSRAKPA